MEKMLEAERATQVELRQGLRMLFQGAIRLTLEMAWPAAAAPTRGKLAGARFTGGFEGGRSIPSPERNV